MQRGLGERARLLATKLVGNQTDEAPVYLAVERALITGKQTLVLTRDADVEEQFKLLWLIDTHYREMLLADRYVLHAVRGHLEARPHHWREGRGGAMENYPATRREHDEGEAHEHRKKPRHPVLPL